MQSTSISHTESSVRQVSSSLVPNGTKNDGIHSNLEKDSVIKIVSPLKVFNLPLFETYLVMDCRDEVSYRASHVHSSFNYPPLPINSTGTVEEINHHIQRFVDEMSLSYINERWDPIVLYASTTNEASMRHMFQFAEMLSTFIHTKDSSITTITEPANSVKRNWPLEVPDMHSHNSFISNIVKKTHQIWIVDGGFEVLRHYYPVLCTPTVDNGGSLLIPLPFQLSILGDGVFIGKCL